MSLKNLIKVANYYDVKYGFGKIAGSKIRKKLKKLFSEFESYVDPLAYIDLRSFDEFPDYFKDIPKMFEGYLSDEQIKILVNYAHMLAGGTGENGAIKRSEFQEAIRKYKDLKNKILATEEGQDEELDLPERFNRYKNKRIEEMKMPFEHVDPANLNIDEYEDEF